jgi:catechol 2,3-dioxygenase-like lactoylglutathione lyase family enzyme
MSAKINHVAIVSSNYSLLGQFYQALFGMKVSDHPRPESAITVGDGYLGLNINPRRPGRPAGLDHFGIQVEDVETCFERINRKFPTVKWLERPADRPFAGISTYDPDHNIFDLSQAEMANRRDIYAAGDWQQDRYINHFALRTPNPEHCAEFYCEVFDLNLANRQEGDENYYVSDGRMTIALMPWDIDKYEGTGIVRPGPDHFGFKVESIAAFKESMKTLAERNDYLAPRPPAAGSGGHARAKLFSETCGIGQIQLSDIDNVLIDVSE